MKIIDKISFSLKLKFLIFYFQKTSSTAREQETQIGWYVK